MKHSLCFSSIVSNAQPSESMPTRKSCLGVKSSMWYGKSGCESQVVSEHHSYSYCGSLPSACGTYFGNFCAA